MASRNGYLVIIEQDINSNSDTFGQTRESEVYDTNSCPLQDANWQLTSSYCQVSESGAQEGNRVDVYTDMNPASDTYLSIQEQVIPDITTCPIEDNSSDWMLDGSECELKTYNNGKLNNTGIRLDTYTDVNEFSSSFNTTKVERVEDSETCPAPDTNPNWNTISKSCNTIEYEGQIYFDGASTAIQQDINEWSDTFNTIRNYVSDDNECTKTIGRMIFIGNVNSPDVIDCTDENWTNTFVIKDTITGTETSVVMNKDNINSVLFYFIPERTYTYISSTINCGGTATERTTFYFSTDGINYYQTNFPSEIAIVDNHYYCYIAAYKA